MEDNVTNASESAGEVLSRVRRAYVRSKYLFPSYDMGVALDIAKIIDTQGAGSLSEASTAMALGLSAKSSAFDLRLAACRQFGLIERHARNIHTTRLARGIFRFIDEKEREDCLVRAFYNVELFRVIGDRYQGVPLPSEDILRNLMERELGVKRERVADALSVFMKSAKVAGVLQESQGKTYLLREPIGAVVAGMPQREKEGEQYLKPQEPPPSGRGIEPVTTTWNVSVDTKDLVGMDAEAIKAAMDGLERLARIVVLKQKGSEESGEKEE